jgi:hypothetical protein
LEVFITEIDSNGDGYISFEEYAYSLTNQDSLKSEILSLETEMSKMERENFEL